MKIVENLNKNEITENFQQDETLDLPSALF